jgi:hypothetical protein
MKHSKVTVRETPAERLRIVRALYGRENADRMVEEYRRAGPIKVRSWLQEAFRRAGAA